MITVACVWVKGNVPYHQNYVVNLARMVRRWMDRPYRFVCLTDTPRLVPAQVEAIAIPNPKPMFGWWSKLELFNRARGIEGRVLYLDLDTLIVGSLAGIVDYPSPFALLGDGGSSFNPQGKRKVIKRFNSSVMVFDGGTNPDLWSAFTPDVSQRLHGDQDWIAERHPEADTLPGAWAPRLSSFSANEDGVIPAGAKVVLSKVPKNHIAAARWPWFDAIWRAA